MKNLDVRLPKLFSQHFFPILLILIANLIVGVVTFQDYGLSWDEPLFYQYADAIPYAYSISARLSGDFDIERAYGPSAEDHKIYGPIYLLLAKPVVDALDWALPVPRADLWHLVNFLTFQAGVLFFFAFCLNWMEPWAAFGTTLFFSTQPILWGHSWINPKDMPFTTFFVAALYLGYKMVDALSEATAIESQKVSISNEAAAKRWRMWRSVLQILAIILVLVSLATLVFYGQIQEMVSNLIQDGYQASPDSLMGKLFASLAINAQSTPEGAYINKGLVILYRIKITMVIGVMLLLIPTSALTFWTPAVQRCFGWLIERLSPLPLKPEWWWNRLSSWKVLLKVLLAGVILGMVVSIRVVGPLAGVLVCLYFIFKPGRHSLGGMVIYLLSAALALYAAWPYLWSSPLARFIDVLQHMSHNPKILPVLFNGLVFPSNQLPMTYLPVMMGITLTWPVWPLFFTGLWAVFSRFKSKRIDWRSISTIVIWFLLPFIYVLMLRPPMYDGYRHFLFILPPVFILGGLAIQAIWERLRTTWSFALVIIVLVVPGVIGLIRLHPYEYTYYNLLVGETGGAYRRYETDFWLTCYKEIMTRVDGRVSPDTTLFVHRQPSIAQEYASPGIIIERFDPEDDRTFSGSLLLLTTRANSDLSLHPEALEIIDVGREGAKFCLVKDIP